MRKRVRMEGFYIKTRYGHGAHALEIRVWLNEEAILSNQQMRLSLTAGSRIQEFSQVENTGKGPEKEADSHK